MRKNLGLLLILATAARLGMAETTFEGYYKITNKGEHVGFSVVRWGIDPHQHIRTLSVFIQTLDLKRSLHRIMLTEKMTEVYRPIESDYRADWEDTHAHYQVIFSGQTVKTISYVEKKKIVKEIQVSSDIILSDSMAQILAAMKPKKGSVFQYGALNESKMNVEYAQVRVTSVESHGKHQIYKLMDTFNDPESEIWLTDNGQILARRAPTRGVLSELVMGPDEAIGNLEFNRSDLVKVFGEIPVGKKNARVTDGLKVGMAPANSVAIDYSRDPHAQLLKPLAPVSR